MEFVHLGDPSLVYRSDNVVPGSSVIGIYGGHRSNAVQRWILFEFELYVVCAMANPDRKPRGWSRKN